MASRKALAAGFSERQAHSSPAASATQDFGTRCALLMKSRLPPGVRLAEFNSGRSQRPPDGATLLGQN